MFHLKSSRLRASNSSSRYPWLTMSSSPSPLASAISPLLSGQTLYIPARRERSKDADSQLSAAIAMNRRSAAG